MVSKRRLQRDIRKRARGDELYFSGKFYIATEGEKTEKQYFEKMFKSRRYEIKVIRPENSRSAPGYVLSALNEFVEKHKPEIQKGDDSISDEFWLVVDTDRWTRASLAALAKEVKLKNFQLAVSNPCFEVFLYLHLKNMTEAEAKKKYTSQEMKKMAQRLGAVNGQGDVKDKTLQGKENLAVRRAKKMDINPGHRWPLTTGTHVYRLVEKLIANR